MIRKRDLRERLEVMKFYKGPEDIYLFILITILYSSHPSKYFDVFFFLYKYFGNIFLLSLRYSLVVIRILFIFLGFNSRY